MHKEEHDERSFDGRDEERHNRIKGSQVHEGDSSRRYGQDKQDDTDGNVKSLRMSCVFVFNHGNPLDRFRF